MEQNIQTSSKTTPKDFFLWAAAMLTFYISIFSFIALVFDYINYAFPDPLHYYATDPYSSGVSYYMASLVVLFPLFLLFMRWIYKDITRDSARAGVWVRRWALYLTLFIAGATLAGDLVTLVMYFFDGDITLRFALKVFVLLLVMGGVFLHFLADLRGYWQKNSAKARAVAFSSVVLVAATIIAGFFIVGTPWQARLYRYDVQKINDLQSVQSSVFSYWRTHNALPTSLSTLTVSGYSIPEDLQTNQPYEYKVTGTSSFKLCAVFNAPIPIRTSLHKYQGIYSTQWNTWTHGAGRTCFTRTITKNSFDSNGRFVPTK